MNINLYEGAVYHYDRAVDLLDNSQKDKAIDHIESGYECLTDTPLYDKKTLRSTVEVAVDRIGDGDLSESMRYLDDILNIIEEHQEEYVET